MVNPALNGLQSASNTYQTYDSLKRRRRMDALEERNAALRESREGRYEKRQDEQLELQKKQAAANEARIAEQIRQARDEVMRSREQRQAEGQALAGTLEQFHAPWASPEAMQSANRAEAQELLRTGKLGPEAAKVVVSHYANLDKAEALKAQIGESIANARSSLNSGRVGTSMGPDGERTRDAPQDQLVAGSLDRSIKGLTQAAERMNSANPVDIQRAAVALDGFNEKVESLAREQIENDKRRAAVQSFLTTAAESKAKYAGSSYEADIAGIMSQIQTDERYSPQNAHNDLMRVTAKAAGYVPSVRVHGVEIEDPQGDLAVRKPVSARSWSKLQRATAEYIDKNPMVAKMGAVPEAVWFGLDLDGLEESGAEAMPGDKLAHGIKYMRAAVADAKQKIDAAVQAGKLKESDAEEALETAGQAIQQEFAAVMAQHGLDGVMADPLMQRQAELILQGKSAALALRQTMTEWHQLQREEQAKAETVDTTRPPEADWFGAPSNMRQPGTRVVVPK